MINIRKPERDVIEMPSSKWRDNYMDSLRKMQLDYNIQKSRELMEMPQYNFNMINREKKKMFNDCEMQFLEETIDRDLKTINLRADQMANEMASLGKKFSDLKIVQSKLLSINECIKADKQDRKCC